MMAKLRGFRWIALALSAICVCSAISAETPNGLALTGMIADWHATANGAEFKQIRASVDEALTSKKDLDITYGPALITMYRVTLHEKYWKAADAMHLALMDKVNRNDPMSFEETYSGAVFAALYSATVHENFGLVMQVLADRPQAGKHAPGKMLCCRADWVNAALVDALEVMPPTASERSAFLAELRKSITARDKQGLDAGGAVVSRMRVYSLLKAVRLGYVPVTMEPAAVKAGKTLRDAAASSAGEAEISAASMMLSSELDQAATATLAQDKVVAMDAWFNSQRRKDPRGNEELFHYKWNDDANSGFSFFGRAFQRYGAKLTEVVDEPTYEHLKNASVYFIVSPDIPAKNPDPHYVNAKDVDAITKWVSDGGVLIMMMNDVHNTEFEHTNTLSERFGIHFNPVIKNTVEGDKWEQAKVEIPATTGVFEHAHTAYMKEVCTISVQEPAKAVLRDHLHTEGEVFIAEAKYGKGTVLAIVDPWLYNEYTDGKKLPVEYDQFAAAKDLARWALSVAK